MHARDLEHFRDHVAIPRMMQLFEKTHISEGSCCIDKLEIDFLDGRSCGHETYIEASGMIFRNGEVEEYLFSEADISVEEFFASHRDCIFVADGDLLVSDELEDMELRTRMRNIDVCQKLFPMMTPPKGLQIEFVSIAYEKMKHLLTTRQSISATHGKPSLEDAISKARESATEKNASRHGERKIGDSKEIDR